MTPAAPERPDHSQTAAALPGAGDTIVAIATPPGRGAIALLRLSGPRALEIAERVLSPMPDVVRTPVLATLRDEAGAIIDRPLVTLFRAPASYTGETLIELSTHGGWYVPAAALAALQWAGARVAWPGEFTRRAVLNGKMDLLQAEAVGDLVDAASAAMHRTAIAQLDGGLSRRIVALRDRLVDLEALIAYDIDFPEEDEGPVSPERVLAAADSAAAEIRRLLATAPAGEAVRRGALVVLAGAPNVGKSSLFNALLGQSRAIVTEVPGTTRDALEAVLDTGSWPLRLVDTAGLRESADTVERLGIEVSSRYLADADVVLACSDDPTLLPDTAARVRMLSGAPLVAVRTKSDLAGEEQRRAQLVAVRDELANQSGGSGSSPAVSVSAETGEGLQELLAAVMVLLDRSYGTVPGAEPALVTRERQRRALQTAGDELRAFTGAWTAGNLPPTVAAVHVRSATAALEEMIGGVDVEDVLDRVFSTFCVGK